MISATKALEKWLGAELPRMPRQDGKRVGTGRNDLCGSGKKYKKYCMMN
jgi:uncharacterized protein YecA (UPF0149 family)